LPAPASLICGTGGPSAGAVAAPVRRPAATRCPFPATGNSRRPPLARQSPASPTTG